MTKEFVVIDHEGQVSMGLKKDEAFPESFATKAAADEIERLRREAEKTGNKS
jgi:hypothetical protein